jgi:DNA-binding transcriptional MerR regulator
LAVKTDRTELSVEELAQRTGMTVRNLREWQGLGLLNPPTKRGRTAYYGSDHIRRIDRIRNLRGEGFSLKVIARILEHEETGDDLLPFAQALRRPFHDESPELVSLREALTRFKFDSPRKLKQAVSQRWLARSSKLGLVRTRKDGRFELVSPRLARLAEFMLELGFSMDEILELGECIYRHQEEVAETFAHAFETRVFESFERGEGPVGDSGAVTEALEELRPYALDSVETLFRIAMDRTAARVVEEKAGP